MSSLALMRLLEASPGRYDRGMRWLTGGAWDDTLETLARWLPAADAPRVLEVGCGTGALTERLLCEGARVLAIDQSPEMLALAHERLDPLSAGSELREMTAAEIDGLPSGSFDAVFAAHVFSEMSGLERMHVLRESRRLLVSGGALAIADEVRPPYPQRLVLGPARAALAGLAWTVVGRVSRPLAELGRELEAAAFGVRAEQPFACGTLCCIRAEARS